MRKVGRQAGTTQLRSQPTLLFCPTVSVASLDDSWYDDRCAVWFHPVCRTPVPVPQGCESQVVVVGDAVTLSYVPADDVADVVAHVVVEWEGGRHGDMVADAVIAVVLQVRECVSSAERPKKLIKIEQCCASMMATVNQAKWRT